MRNSTKAATCWITAFVLFLGGAFGIACWLRRPARTPKHKLNASDPEYERMLCGPMSLLNALGRLGINCFFEELASQCEVGPEGVTLRELERVADGIQETKSRLKRLDWDGLRRLDGAAVLFVNGRHFVAADPRETAPSGSVNGPAVRIYDEARPAQWVTRGELEKIWRGETLVIERRRPSSGQAAGPRIEWDECFIDNGVLKPNSIGRYAFPFRNAGDSDLTIDRVRKSCGCATYTIAGRRLAPGQVGVVEADVDLRDSEGYFLHYLILETNDATKPLSILRMAGGVPRTRVLSALWISLGDLPQGAQVTREFYASDPGFGGLEIRDVYFVPTAGLDIAEHLTCSITYDLLGRDVQRAASPAGYRGKPEDYVIRLALGASEKCPVGRFEGEVHVVAAADDAVRTHRLVIEGAVVQDVHPVPGVALITLDGEGAGSAAIQLRSRTRHEFQILETWPDARAPVKIERADGSQAPGGEFVLSAAMPDVVAGASPVKSAAFFKLHNGTEVCVPIAILKPPQPGPAAEAAGIEQM